MVVRTHTRTIYYTRWRQRDYTVSGCIYRYDEQTARGTCNNIRTRVYTYETTTDSPARAFANNDLYNRRLSNLLGVSGTKDDAKHGGDKKKKEIKKIIHTYAYIKCIRTTSRMDTTSGHGGSGFPTGCRGRRS